MDVPEERIEKAKEILKKAGYTDKRIATFEEAIKKLAEKYPVAADNFAYWLAGRGGEVPEASLVACLEKGEKCGREDSGLLQEQGFSRQDCGTGENRVVKDWRKSGNFRSLGWRDSSAVSAAGSPVLCVGSFFYYFARQIPGRGDS